MANFLQTDWGLRQSQADTAAPTSGSYQQFDRVENSSPALSTPIAWVCTASGSPGTWKAVAVLQDVATVTPVTAAASIGVSSNIAYITGSGAHNITVAAPSSANAGTVINFTNASSGTVTAVAATGTQILGLATVATNTSGTFKASGTSWYRV